MQTLKIVLALSLTALLTACVTTTDSRFTKKADPQRAVDDYVILGISYLRQGDHKMARKKIERALAIDPSSAPAHNAMALFWQDRGEAELADKEFLIALDLDSDYSPANYHYGRFLMVLGRSDSCDYLRKAARDIHYSGRKSAFEDLGLCHYSQRDYKPAIAAYEKAWQLEGSSLIAALNLTAIYVDQKRFDLAQRWFKRLESGIKNSQQQHTALSLWLGIEIARANKDRDAEANYAFKLKKSFPQSDEYQRYKNLR